MTEYLVEVKPGIELVYRTPFALRAAMRRGEITTESRIYHRAASRWISITEHPEYRRYLAERRPPEWLEPIPFEPVEEPPPKARSRGLPSLRRVLDRVAGWVRASVGRVATASRSSGRRVRPEAPVEPAPSRYAPPAERTKPAPPPRTQPHTAPPASAKPPSGEAPPPRRWTFLP